MRCRNEERLMLTMKVRGSYCARDILLEDSGKGRLQAATLHQRVSLLAIHNHHYALPHRHLCLQHFLMDPIPVRPMAYG